MMTIDPHTKISAILKANANALEAIVSISPKFTGLRNPLLRKVMAGRTTLAAASRMGGCRVEDFYQKLEPLGFIIGKEKRLLEAPIKEMPSFLRSLTAEQVVELDVRPVIAAGGDPLEDILSNVKQLQRGQVLRLVNTFEPTPLILLLEKKGFQAFVEMIDKEMVVTYLYQTAGKESIAWDVPPGVYPGWEQSLNKFGGHVQQLDVRHLPMPQPMLAILETLDQLPQDAALYVFHRRIPVYLLPELAQKGFEYRIKEVNESEFHLLIFKS
jgi:uncharacterized protein (DUF2249 family)